MKTKAETKERVKTLIVTQGFTIVGEDFERPWGGFFLIADEDTNRFVDLFFPDDAAALRESGQKLSPKILVVAPSVRLSWQYHDRRAELHNVIEGPVGYPLSQTDEQPHLAVYDAGAVIRIPQGTRHRLVGLNDWGIVAEVWQHTDPNNPSNETDNHRLQDDFNRT